MLNQTVILLLAAFVSFSAYGQSAHVRVTGRIEGLKGDPGPLFVEARDIMGYAVVERAAVAADGTFAFEAPNGNYDVRVVAGIQREAIAQEYVQLNGMNSPLVFRLQPPAESRPITGVVSVKDLRARVPKKAWQAFVKAQQFAEDGKPGLAIGQLERAIALYPDWRDAHTNLGAELLRSGKAEPALAEFREALRIGPPAAPLYANLGTALAALRRIGEAETAVRTALHMDASDARAQYLLGHILAVQPGRDREALERLHAAESQLPAARIVAAQLLMRSGANAEATAELRAYLGSGDRGHRQVAEEMLRKINR